MIPNIFISSTIADLRYLRDALRGAVIDLAYTPVMSEHGEVGYLSPSTAAESCYRSIRQCQMAVIIIGRRYGEPSEDGISVTHKEFRTAREHDIPLIAFVESEVMHYKDVHKASPSSDTWNKFALMDHPKLTFGLIDEITSAKSYNGLIAFNNVEEARKALKLQIANFVGESLSQVISPMRSDIKDVLAEIGTLRHELSESRKPDPDFSTTLRFILDDSHNSGLQYLIKHTIGPIDKAIPFLIKSRTFDEFIKNIEWNVKIRNDLDTIKPSVLDYELDMMGMMHFMVPAPKEDMGFGKACFAICKDKTLIMNNYAKCHFDWMIEELNKHAGTK